MNEFSEKIFTEECKHCNPGFWKSCFDARCILDIEDILTFSNAKELLDTNSKK